MNIIVKVDTHINVEVKISFLIKIRKQEIEILLMRVIAIVSLLSEKLG